MIDVDLEIKQALLNKDQLRAEVFRAIKNEILKFKTQKNAPEYNDSEEIRILSKMAKAHEESIESFRKANRDDLRASEEAEVQIIYSLLPKAADRNSIDTSLKEYMNQKYNDLSIPKKEMGLAVKYLKALFPVNDGKEISEIIKTYIK